MNGSLSSRFLGSDLAIVALRGLERLRNKQPLDHEEEYAVERLYSWLGGVKDSGPVPLELANISDESQRAYLLSFRGKSDGSRRHYILPKRPARQEGETSSRSSTDDGEALSNPKLQSQLQLLEDWEAFDVFEVARLTDGRPLQTVGLNLLRKRGLISSLQLSEDKLRSFLQEVEEEYQPNPYHSSVHAADVTQALAAMLATDTFTQQLTDLELLSLIVAAIIHDLGHPGVTNEFLVRTSSEAALQYNDQSINENMHLACAFKMLLKEENNFLCGFPEEHYRYFRRLVMKIVLATDMAVHRDLVDDFMAHVRLWGPDLNAWPAEKRVVALQMLLHSADISNPARPLQKSALWGARVQEEFFQQGDKEEELGLSVSVVCDRGKASVPNNQAAFVDYVMKPSFLVLSELAPSFVARVMPHIEASQQHWHSLLEGGGGGAPRRWGRTAHKPALSGGRRGRGRGGRGLHPGPLP